MNSKARLTQGLLRASNFCFKISKHFLRCYIVGLFTCQQNKRRILLCAVHRGGHEKPLCKTLDLSGNRLYTDRTRYLTFNIRNISAVWLMKNRPGFFLWIVIIYCFPYTNNNRNNNKKNRPVCGVPFFRIIRFKIARQLFFGNVEFCLFEK